MQFLCSLRPATSLGYNDCRKYLTQTYLNISYTKMQCSVSAINWPSSVVQLYYIWLASHAINPETFSSYLVCPGDEAKDKEKSTVSVIGSGAVGSLGPGNEDCCIQKPLCCKQLNDSFDPILREAEGKYKSHCCIKCEDFISCPKMLAGIFSKKYSVCVEMHISR